MRTERTHGESVDRFPTQSECVRAFPIFLPVGTVKARFLRGRLSVCVRVLPTYVRFMDLVGYLYWIQGGDRCSSTGPAVLFHSSNELHCGTLLHIVQYRKDYFHRVSTFHASDLQHSVVRRRMQSATKCLLMRGESLKGPFARKGIFPKFKPAAVMPDRCHAMQNEKANHIRNNIASNRHSLPVFSGVCL